MDEWVGIKNATGQSVDMTDWTLRDENKNIYFFPDNFTLSNGRTVQVWTKWGINSSTDLYWDSNEPVWNDGGDCAYLRDSDNEFVTSYCYGN